MGLRSLTEAADTAAAGGKLVSHICGALAGFERALDRKASAAALASVGQTLCRGRGILPRRGTAEEVV